MEGLRAADHAHLGDGRHPMADGVGGHCPLAHVRGQLQGHWTARTFLKGIGDHNGSLTAGRWVT